MAKPGGAPQKNLPPQSNTPGSISRSSDHKSRSLIGFNMPNALNLAGSKSD
jgi:hypothetical protein